MERTRRTIALFLTLLVLILCSACGEINREKAQIQSIIEQFESGCQSLDLNELLNCIDPADTQLIRAGMEGFEMLTGEDAEKALSETVEQLYMLVDQILINGSDWSESNEKPMIEDYLESISIIPEEIKQFGEENEYAEVSCTIRVTLNGKEYKTDTQLNLVRKEKQWYIDLS